MAVSWGGTRGALLRVPQVMGGNTFLLHLCTLRQPNFAHAPLRHCRRSLNRPPCAAGWVPRQNPRLSTRTRAPSQPIGEVVSLPETYSVCHSPPKTPPDRDWSMHECACICMYCMYCLYMYVYVCICMYCLYEYVSYTNIYIPTNWTLWQSRSWLSGTYEHMSLWRRVFESHNRQSGFAAHWFTFCQLSAGHQVLAWATISLWSLVQKIKSNTCRYIRIHEYTSKIQAHTLTYMLI